MAYIAPPGQDDTPRTFKWRVYNTFHILAMAGRGNRNLSVTQIRPSTSWTQVWKKLHSAWVSEQAKSTWYTMIHELIPTNERLYELRLVDSDRCRHCGRQGTIQHRLTEGNEGAVIWTWTWERIAWLLRKNPPRIPADWSIRPQFWPSQCHGTRLWILAHLPIYRIRERRPLSLIDDIHFMRRASWKSYQETSRTQRVGNYLSVL
jgi:hypothetical protein